MLLCHNSAPDLRLEERTVAAPQADELQIEISVGGVCGSDLHYYNNGGFGTVKLREPMVLGHEVAGTVTQVGSAVNEFTSCQYCQQGLHNHCLNMRFYGSAMPFPHIQGAFQQTLNAAAVQCVKANQLSPAEAAMAEPLSVVLHAAAQAGELLGKRVLVTGCGPIGVLAVLVARRAGAAEIVTTDLAEHALGFASSAGADRTINTQMHADALTAYNENKGYFDVLFECSGAVSALTAGIQALRPRGIVVQLGLGGDMALPMMAITAKELQLRGSFRFHQEFPIAVQLMSAGLIDVKSLITHTLPLANMRDAFDIANDRSIAMKTHIDFQAA